MEARFGYATTEQVIPARRLDSLAFIVLCFLHAGCCSLGAAEFRRWASSLV
jgi:hypothetical protein